MDNHAAVHEKAATKNLKTVRMTSSYSAPAQSGIPSPVPDDPEDRMSLDQQYNKHPHATFMVECTGDSMINAFIPPKARLVVDQSLTPQNGDIVLAEWRGEFMIKFLKKNDFKCWLVPANRKYPQIEITGDRPLRVWGVVTTIIIDAKDVREAMM